MPLDGGEVNLLLLAPAASGVGAVKQVVAHDAASDLEAEVRELRNLVGVQNGEDLASLTGCVSLGQGHDDHGPRV